MNWIVAVLVVAALALTAAVVAYASLAIANREGRRRHVQLAAAYGGLLVVTIAASAFVRSRQAGQDLVVDYWRDAFLPRRGDRQALDATLLSL